MKNLYAILFVLLSLFLVGCNSQSDSQSTVSTDFSSLESSVQSIHKLFNQQEFEVLYQQATNSAQNSFEEKQFMSFVEHLRETLGEVQGAEIANQMKTNSGQTAVVVDVDYENDSGTERWVLEQVEGEWRWSEFNYNAETLMQGN